MNNHNFRCKRLKVYQVVEAEGMAYERNNI